MIKTRITGQTGNNSDSREVHVHPFNTATGNHVGLTVLSHDFIQTEPATIFFTNDTVGIAMNQNVTFSGTPELIFDGGSGGTEWAGTANAGTWNFADTGKTTITSANNNDSATFDDAGTIDMSGHTAITGKVDLDTYNPLQNNILIQFGLAGALLGNSVNLNDFIDTGNFSEQSFVIPKGDLGIDSLTIDEMTITITRIGGAKPTIKFDDFQIEQIGTPLIFSLNVSSGDKFHIEELIFAYADVLDAQANADASMPNLSYDKILGLNALTNGFTISRTKGGKTLFSASIKTLGAQISAGAKADEPWSDGTNTFVVLRAVFKKPLILTGDPDDTLTIQINDNMSGLLQFTASGRGGLEKSGN